MNERMTPGKCPAGTRVMVADFMPVIGSPDEVRVLEWSRGGRVKLAYESGRSQWAERPPFIVEVLESSEPDPPRAVLSPLVARW